MAERDPHAGMGEVPTQAEEEEEGRALTGGPGVVATKSQAKGAVGGGAIFALIGAIVGLVVGLIAFDGAMIVITAVVGGVAGLVFGGVAGGVTKSMKETTERQVDA